MSDGDDIKLNLQTEKNKLEKMSNKQKLDYFKSYYLGPLIAIVIVILCVIWFLYEAIIGNKIVMYSGGAIGCYVSEAGEKYLTEGFLERLEGNPQKECVRFTSEIANNYDRGDGFNYRSDGVEVYALIAAGEYNYLLISGKDIDHYMKMEAFADITSVAQNYNIPDEDCISGTNGQILSIKLPDEVTRKIGVTSEDGVYLGIIIVQQTSTNNEAFFKYIFE